MTGAEASGIMGLFMGLGALSYICAAVWYILQVIAKWKMFKKMDEAGWKSIIPFYSDYILFKRTWKTSYFWVFIISVFVVSLLRNRTDSKLIAVITLILLILAIVIAVIQLNKLSKSFGHGVAFTIGLIFLSPIFLLILGFGDSQYIGNTSENV